MSIDPDQKLNILILPEGSVDGRRFSITRRRLKVALVLGGVFLVLGVVMAGSWFVLFQRSLRLGAAEREVLELRKEVEAAQVLGERLVEIEAQYEQIRSLFGITRDSPPDAWLPPPGGARSAATDDDRIDGGVPDTWPLTEKGFVSREFGVIEDAGGEHLGVDVAIPAGSYIRTVAPGWVVEVGSDSIYGNFVRVDHGAGHESFYAHALETLVESGDRLRSRQVIALVGSTGQSSAPHLHFEILLDGERVDPLSILEPR